MPLTATEGSTILAPLRTMPKARLVHKRISFVLATAVAAGLIGTNAAAAPAERLGCPAGDDLMTVERINQTITTPGYEQAVIDYDALSGNGDGYLCVHLLPDAAGKKTPFSPYFALTDNTVANPNSAVVDTARPRPGAQAA
jgi:hypothetical protein